MIYRSLIPILLLTGCGVSEDIGANHCGGDLKGLCRTVFGGSENEERESADNAQQSQIDFLNAKIGALEVNVAAAKSSIQSQQDLILALQSQIELINALLPSLNDSAAITLLQSQLTLLEQRTLVLENQIGTPITGLQSLVNLNTIQIVQLQQNHNVTKLVDPCGNGPGFDEVFMRTSSGKLIASFSDNAAGLNTRFVELLPGNYQTTDGTNCSFAVLSDMSVVPSVEY